ncbi:MAG: hypothetical protein HGB12_09745, partial [Bacteroidetes bacterium]|nr:hypothetical protein [Bacteroidota bacterium]
STGGAADNSAMLDVSSTNQGMRIPRVALTSTTSALPIINPVNSLLVYDSVTAGDVTPGFYYWDGTESKWIRFSTGSGSGWSTSGNSGTDTSSNFIGTTDDKSWVMKTNNTQRMKINKTGAVVIGATNPASSAILDVSSTTKGVLISRMTTAERDLINSPAIGLQIYNTDCNVEEYYNGSCWISEVKSIKAPGDITSNPASTGFCAGSTRTYSILPITGATRYIWTVPAEASITAGLGTTSISVTFGTKSGSVCVTAENNCETSQARCMDVSVDIAPATPGNITGPITAVPGQTSPVSYSIASITGATTYNWTVPPGASITSGTGTTNIVVNYSCNTTAGYVAVTQTAACGTSAPASLVIAVNPLSITAGAAKSGPGTLGGSPTASGGYGTYVYAWSPSVGLSATNTANPTANACVTNTYTLTVTDINTCSATSSVVVTKNLIANAGLSSPVSVCPGTIGGSPTASLGAGSYTYLWSPSEKLVSATLANPTPNTCLTTSYTVTVTDANSCTATSSMTYILGAPPSPATVTINYTGTVVNWTVPTGVTSIKIEAYGAAGGAGKNGAVGGLGGYVYGNKNVTAGNVLNIYVGGVGGNATNSSGGTGGWNGGGSGGYYGSGDAGGGGGGASDVRIGGTALTNRIIVAGASGGGGDGTSAGGAGRYSTGGNGTINGSYNATNCGAGGTQSAGGVGATNGPGSAGSLGLGGNGANVTNSKCGGGGGAGYYGGGGGGDCGSGGGGGGSGSYSGMTSTTGSSDGVQTGHGQVIITY